jgi:hypothetical protein
MRQGGNAQLRDFFQKLQIDNSTVEVLYTTKAATHYREKLKERVDLVLSGAVSAEIPAHKKNTSNSTSDSHSGSVGTLSANNTSTSATSSNENIEYITVTFTTTSLGLTLTKDYRNHAAVTRLVPGGAANVEGVQVGDVVCGVAGKGIIDYDEIMHMIPYMSRPLEIKFKRFLLSNSIQSQPEEAIDSSVSNAGNSNRTVKIKLSANHIPHKSHHEVASLTNENVLNAVSLDTNKVDEVVTEKKTHVDIHSRLRKPKKNDLAARDGDNDEDDDNEIDIKPLHFSSAIRKQHSHTHAITTTTTTNSNNSNSNTSMSAESQTDSEAHCDRQSEIQRVSNKQDGIYRIIVISTQIILLCNRR